jgi:plastocyanin
VKRILALSLALVALAGSGASGSAAEAPTRTVTMPGKAYDPSHLSVLVGTSVTWKNEDSINHTVTADGDAFASGYVPPGGSFSFTFAQQGHYAFHCSIHRFMKGEVDVFGLVLTGPEGPVASGHRVVFAGLSPPGTATVALRGPRGDVVVHPRPDGSFAVRTAIGEPGRYRAVAGALVSPTVRVLVRPTVRVAASGHRLRASVSPGRPGATAVLQAYDREHFAWRSVADGKLDRASRVAWRAPRGVARARVLVVGTQGWADGVSQPIVFRGGSSN